MESTTFIKLIQQQGPNTNLEVTAICKSCMFETVAGSSLGKGPRVDIHPLGDCGILAQWRLGKKPTPSPPHSVF